MEGITAIVLSAAFSSRMKKFKLGLPFKNHTIIEEVLFQLSKTSIKEIILVTGHYKESIEKLLATNSTIKIIHNKNYALGMTTSIQCGILEASTNAKGFLICLGDLPFILATEYNKILSKIESIDDKNPFIVRPFFKNKPANPVFFSRHFKNDLLDLKHMEGAKILIKRNGNYLHNLMLETESGIMDIDTPLDYANYIHS